MRKQREWEAHQPRFRLASAMSLGLVFVADSSKPMTRSSFTLSIRVNSGCLISPFKLHFCFQQFRDAGCENCPFFKMEEDHERIVEVTTPNFNGYYILKSKPLVLVFSVSWVGKFLLFMGAILKTSRFRKILLCCVLVRKLSTLE